MKKTEEDKSGYRYKFKIENCGIRNIIDIELTARVSVKMGRTWNIVYVPLSPDGSTSYRIPILLPAKKNKIGRRKILFLYTNSTDILHDWPIFPEEIRRAARNKTLLLDDLMRSGKTAKLEIQAYCYDSFSGSRTLFVSKPYSVSDIVEGPFDRKGLDVLPHQPKKMSTDSVFTERKQQPVMKEDKLLMQLLDLD
ncbi:MAG: hypothetical protein NZU74_19995 [Chloroflexaceae bacterium]|nr:hypothetical protein [Chloroflexaceae bacterium]